MLPSSLSAKRLAACSVESKVKAVVLYTGMAREPVSVSGVWPPCRQISWCGDFNREGQEEHEVFHEKFLSFVKNENE